MRERTYANGKDDPRIKSRHNQKADFHLKQVVVLNDFFPMGDTAEMDASKAVR